MAAGQKHHAVGTLHVKVGHAIVFEKETHLEDDGGAKHPVRSENRVLSWDEAKTALAPEEISALQSIADKVLAFDQAREKAAQEAQAKAAEAVAKTTEENGTKKSKKKAEA